MKKWQIAAGVVVALVAVLSLSVVVFAQGPTPPTGVPQGYGPGMGRRMMGGAQAQMPMADYGFRLGVNGGSLVDVTARVTGLKVEDVVKELQVGKTFADVAKAHGKTTADVVNAFLADRETALDKAVAEGRITQDAASTLSATMKTNVEQHVNGTWAPRGMDHRFTGQPPQGLGPRWSR